MLKQFFRLHRPYYDASRMKGGQYRSAIFYQNEEEAKIAKEVKREAEKESGKTLYTQIAPVKTFYRAEEYHQNYYGKN